MEKNAALSLPNLIKRFPLQILFTQIVMLAETVIMLLFPLFMGYAINDLIGSSFSGFIKLAVLGILALVIGSIRRFCDTRIYAAIFVTITDEMVERERQKDKSVSVINARIDLLTEFVYFLENSFPEIIESFIGIAGTLIVIFTLSFKVFVACLTGFFIVILVYVITGGKMYLFNKNFNDQQEKQVDILSRRKRRGVFSHLKALMKWQIKLSDIETFNFFIILAAMVVIILFSIYTVSTSGETNVGTIFSSLMYVFEFTESVSILPFYYSELIRLSEITTRLKES